MSKQRAGSGAYRGSRIPDPTAFLDTLLARLPDLSHLHLDHLCYRVATLREYAELKAALHAHATLLAESAIGGRPIATFRLHTPVRYGARTIELLELPAPKPGRPYPTGYDHVEFVTDRPLPAFADYLTDTLHIAPERIDRAGLRKAGNPDLRIRFPDGTGVKFHEQPLDAVIAREREEE